MNPHPTSTEMSWGRGTPPLPQTPSPKTKLGRLHKSLDTPFPIGSAFRAEAESGPDRVRRRFQEDRAGWAIRQRSEDWQTIDLYGHKQSATAERMELEGVIAGLKRLARNARVRESGLAARGESRPGSHALRIAPRKR